MGKIEGIIFNAFNKCSQYSAPDKCSKCSRYSVLDKSSKYSRYSAPDKCSKYSGYSVPDKFSKYNRYSDSENSGKYNKYRHMAGTVVFMAACGFILYGAVRGEAAVVLNKAVNICLECIGLG